jgi:manganese/zinc/iron transport system permease protein
MAELWQAMFPSDPALLWPLAVAVTTGIACSLVGCYLVLRRMSLLGDALAHAVLPGLVVAFIFSGTLAIGAMFFGAFVAAVLTTFLTQSLHRQGGVAEDTSMGVVFTSLFAIGVVLIKRYSEDVHIDASCVLEGNLSLVTTHMIEFALPGWSGPLLEAPRAFLSILPVMVANLLAVLLLWKELKITSFDSALATTLGFRSNLVHYLLMGLVAATTVGSFEAVGSILVIAMLIVPAAAAHLFCDRLAAMLLVAALLAALSAYAGFVGALLLNAEPAGMMAVAAGVVYLLAMLFAPRHGVVAALVRNLRTSLRIVGEDLLALLFRLEELASTRRLGAHEAVKAVGGSWLARLGLWTLERKKLVVATPDLQLTAEGRKRASQLVRSHRLWESFLVQTLGLPLDHVHAPAERMEHYIDEKLRAELASDLAQTSIDPHGKEIP